MGRGGVDAQYKLFCQSAQYEIDIFKNGRYFIGRTEWDKAHVIFNSPHAIYFHGEELLRPEFYKQQNTWAIDKITPYSIFMPSGFNPIKGLHVALEAITLLKEKYPKIKLRVPGIPMNILKRKGLFATLMGEQYLNFIRTFIKRNNLTNNIELLPRLTPAQMVECMQQSHVFLSPTSIDNSPNTVGEAMMIGLPVVVTAVGGLLSFLKDNETCLFTPVGDSYMMALKIMQIFEDIKLAERLSQNAYQTALRRHDISTTIIQYITIYKQCVNNPIQ